MDKAVLMHVCHTYARERLFVGRSVHTNDVPVISRAFSFIFGGSVPILSYALLLSALSS